MPKRKKRTITAEDLYRFELITGFRLSPDGENVIYAVQRVDKKTEKKFSNLWIAPTGRGAPRQFTYGDHTDAAPRWSPDGKTIAFISNRHNEREPQIYLIPVDGGEARKLTDMKGTIADFKWSPDSSKFLVTFIKKDKEAIERESDEQKKKLGVVQRHITRVFYKFDGAGYLPKERAHLWIVSASNGKAVQITKGDVHDEADANWSPDGKTIIFVSNRSDDPDLNIYESQLYTVSAKGGRIKELKTMDGDKMAPKYSPDGKWIAFLGQEGRGQWWKNGRLWIVPSDGKGKAICLTRDYDFDVSHWTINDIIGAVEFVRPCWTNDCKHIHFQVAMHGNTVLKKINVEGKKHVATDVITGDGVVGSYGFDDKQEKFAYYYGTMTDPGQIHFKNLKRNTSKTLTRMNSWLNRVDLGECEEVWFKGAAKNDLQGWILKPPGFSEKRRYPAILEIHGGPLVQYGNLFMHEFYYLAAQGYVVYFSNPRGGQGYGEKHSKAIDNDWGGADYDDIMKWTDYVARKPYIDSSRLGVTGGSYGGYMTNWIIGHTNRFKVAVTQRSVSNLISMWGSSDFNWIFQDAFGKKPPWEDFSNLWRQSPMKYIGNAKTPTLVIHNEMDQRCEIEQGEQVFVALKKLGVDTEFVRFPDEPHGLSRGGRTDRRIVRLNHILRWMDKYLKGSKKK